MLSGNIILIIVVVIVLILIGIYIIRPNRSYEGMSSSGCDIQKCKDACDCVHGPDFACICNAMGDKCMIVGYGPLTMRPSKPTECRGDIKKYIY